LQRDGLLNNTPLTPDNLRTLGDAGLLGSTNGIPHNLGDLSPAQLQELRSAGVLNNVPVTDAQLGQLRQDGLLGPDATGLHSLGDLSPAQLSDLSQAGMLDSVPVTPGELDWLRQAGLLSPNATTGGGGVGSGLAGLDVPPLPGQTAPSTSFPTQIDGVNVTPVDPHTLAAGSGVQVGDIRQPMVRTVGGAGYAGFGTSGVPAPGSHPLQAGGGAVLGADGLSGLAGADGSPGSGGSTSPYGGMPYMPMGGMGGLGGAPGQGRERQRNTWLTEEEKVWGTDPECAPAVVGRGDGPATGEPEHPGVPVIAPPTPDRSRTRRGR
jgi:hypothetical protein